MKGKILNKFSNKRSVLVQIVRSIWKKDLDVYTRKRTLKNREMWRNTFEICLFFLKGLILICIIYLNYYLSIEKFFFSFVSLVLVKFFKLENFLSLFFFLKTNLRFISFFNFLKFFDNFFLVFFNFYITFKKCVCLPVYIFYREKRYDSLFGFFFPSFSFFNVVEVFSKVSFLNFFDFDFFHFSDLKLKHYKNVIPYEHFYFRMNVFCFFFFFRDSETIRMLKYNEHLFNGFLFCDNVNSRVLFLKRYFVMREYLLVTQMCYFKYAVFTMRFLLFDNLKKIKRAGLRLSRGNVKLYKDNFVFNFLANVINSNFVTRWFCFIFEGYLIFYLLIDIYKAVMNRLRLLYVFRWYLYSFMDAARKMYNFSIDSVPIYYFIKNRMELKLSSFVFKSPDVLNYYFFLDVTFNKFLQKHYFFLDLFNFLFGDFNEYYIILTMSNVDENQSYFFNLFRHFKDYYDKLVFLFFSTNLIEYIKWFFCFEYYYWRALNIDFSFKIGLFKYFFDPIFDYIAYSRFLSGGYFMQRLLSKSKLLNRSVFLGYYMFLLYRDIILKSINNSFDFNLIFYFFFSKLYYLDNCDFLYLFLLNSDSKNYFNYLSHQDEIYNSSRWGNYGF